MVKDTKSTFKRSEVFAIGKLVDAAVEGPEVARTYKAGQSDTTVATAASAQLKRQITADDVRRVRHQTHGKLATEDRPSAEMLASLVQAVHAQAAALNDLSRRVALLEDDYTAPPPPQHSHNNSHQRR